MIAALLVCVLSQTKVVTLDSPGWSVPQILAEVSKQTGQDFEAKDDVRNDHVIVHVDHVPIKDFMDRFGAALLSSWTQHDRAYILKRDQCLVSANDLTIQQAFEAGLDATLRKYRSELATQPTFGADLAASAATALRMSNSGPGLSYQNRMDLESGLPAMRALKRLLVLIGSAEISKLSVGQRAVYSTEPNQLQKAFPIGADGIMGQAIAEEAIWSKSMAGFTTDQYMPELVDGSFEGASGAFLAIKRSPGPAGVQAELVIYDSKGTPLCRQAVLLSQPPFFKGVPTRSLVVPIPLDKETIEGLNCEPFYGDLAPLSPLQIGRLARPAEYDPLSLFASGCLTALAKSKGENLIAYGDVGLLETFGPYASERKFDSSWESGLYTTRSITVNDRGGWLIAKPTDFDNYIRSRIDRRLLQDLFEPAVKDGWVKVGPAARYIVDYGLSFPDRYAAMVGQRVFGRTSCPLDPYTWTTEGFYGLLQQDHRLAARVRLGASDLSTAQREALLIGLLSGNISLSPNKGVRLEEGKPKLFDPPVFLTEPTILLSNGIPESAVIKMEQSLENQVVGTFTGSGRTNFSQVETPAAVAFGIVLNEHRPQTSEYVNAFQPSMIDSASIEINFPGASANSSFYSSKKLAERTTDWRKLPPDFVAEIEKEVTVLEKEYKDDPKMFESQPGSKQRTPP